MKRELTAGERVLHRKICERHDLGHWGNWEQPNGRLKWSFRPDAGAMKAMANLMLAVQDADHSSADRAIRAQRYNNLEVE